MTRFALEPIYGSYLIAVVAAVAMIAAIVWVTPQTADRRRRRWLVGLRSFAAAVLLLALFRPSLVRTDTRPGEATLVVAVDTSRSMTLPDGDGSDRWATQAETWRALASGLAGLDDYLKIQLVSYDRTAETVSNPDPETLATLTPLGDVTDLSAPTSAAIRVSGGAPLAGVVLMGDGTHTAGTGGDGARTAAETLDSLGVPLWSVPIGPSADAGAARDVAVQSLPESFQLFAGNEVEVSFEVGLRGLAGNQLPVRLSWVDESGERSEAASRPVLAQRGRQTVPLSVPLIAPSPGTYRLVAEAELQDGEVVSENNRQVAFVDVREGGGRVLYLEGSVRLEQLFLRRALGGFPDLDLTYQWIPADTASRWPYDFGDWFQQNEFDIYIIGDLDASALGDRQMQQLAETVAAGAGLLTLGGFQTYGAGGYADSPLAEVIPVEMDAGRRRGLGGEDREDRPDQLPGPLEVLPARDHPVTELGGDASANPWQTLPPLLGANRLVGPKVAPGVTVLLESPEEEPLLVVGEYGAGRTAALALDSTYRWRREGFQDAHRRFWRQLMLWLLAREDQPDETIRIEIDARRFTASNRPAFRGGVQTVEAEAAPDLIAEVVDAEGNATEIPLSSQAGDPALASAVRGEIPELDPGFYRLRVRPASDDSKLEPASRAFQVIEDSRELNQPMADTVYLKQLAALTVDHGGAAFAPSQVGRLVDLIDDRRRTAETTIVAKYRLGDDPLSGWLLFALFTAAMTSEWWLRRAWGLA